MKHNENSGAEKGGTSVKMYRHYHWLDGQSLPSLDNLYALSKILGVPMDRLIIGTGEYEKTKTVKEPSKHLLYYLRSMGYAWWLLAFLNIIRMSTQGLGYSDLAVMGGIMEMAARSFVCLFLAPRFGYDAIVWADQSAWLMASVYIIPVFVYCMKKVRNRLAKSS